MFTTWMQICGMFFLEIRIKGTFDSSFYASESSTSSDEEDDGTGENSKVFTGIKKLKLCPSNVINTLSQS